MGCFAPDMPAPIDYGKQTSETLQTQINLAPELYDAESNPAYGQPAYSLLALQNLNQLLNGTTGGDQTVTSKALKTGWYDGGNFVSGDRNYYGGRGRFGPAPGGAAADQPTAIHNLTGRHPVGNTREHPNHNRVPAGVTWMTAGSPLGTKTMTMPAEQGLLSLAGQANTAQRANDIGDVFNLGPQATEALLRSNPYNAALLTKLNAQANEGLDAGEMLTPEEQRAVEQQTRASFAARGLTASDSAIAAEVMNRMNYGQELLRQRQGFAQSVLGNNQAIIGDPFMQILGRPSTGVNTAGSFMPGRQFNPESPYAGAVASGNQQMRAAFADPSGMDKIGAVTSIAGKLIGSIAGAFA